MCGRYFIDAVPAELEQAFGVCGAPELAARWNLAPSATAAVLLADPTPGGARWALARWGLEPPWPEAAPSRRLINARSESVAFKPSFRQAWAQRPCVVPARGWYEWSDRGGTRQPYAIAEAHGGLLALAGLWSPRRDGSGIDFAILTAEASPELRPLHARMPALLAPDMARDWLTLPARQRLERLRTAPPARLRHWPVSSRVNSPRHDDPALLAPYGGALALRSGQKRPESAR